MIGLLGASKRRRLAHDTLKEGGVLRLTVRRAYQVNAELPLPRDKESCNGERERLEKWKQPSKGQELAPAPVSGHNRRYVPRPCGLPKERPPAPARSFEDLITRLRR